MAQLLAMGFHPHEARAALLACAKDATAAATYVLQRRQAEQERRQARPALRHPF